jgi:lysophospholipase L1-like esterase
MLGSNDAKNSSLDSIVFKSDTLKIVDRLINETDGRIVILLPTPVFEKNGKANAFGIRKDIIESVIIPVLKEIAAEYSLRCLSLYDLFRDKPQYFEDLVHPDKKGNQIIAEYIYDNIFSNS